MICSMTGSVHTDFHVNAGGLVQQFISTFPWQTIGVAAAVAFVLGVVSFGNY
jgi:ElaB/YqjD/DUF883 family membrane-anchored ribosome-binding protein